MKKHISLVIILLTMLFMAGEVCAESVSDDLGVLITVEPKFTFAIGESVVDMGTVQNGGTGSGSVTMYCGTNHSLPWRIMVRSSLISNGTTYIFLPFFKFYTYGAGDQAGVGAYVPPTNFMTTDKIAYVAALSECSDTDVRVCMGFALYVPVNQMAGTYSATVTATMIEY